ncbi:hypothetical protein HN803_06540 [candidate division WWE3 bacterium]|jgi:hypothetical protein|nr:hypothetical protein [candidate division WWE3 bacterium]MBT7350415.1 hypothetical protein [candidate division WWE3 bacterium]
MKKLLLFALFIAIVFTGFNMFSRKADEAVMVEEVTEEVAMAEPTPEYDVYKATLEDVTEDGISSGEVEAYYVNGVYRLEAAFSDLPELEKGFFYEGWVVREGNDFDVISTGETKMSDGVEINAFTRSENLIDHTFYVLTLEPDDGDPAPAEHILEGTLVLP